MTTCNHDILDSLTGIGLDSSEAAIYLTILELGPSSVWDIAQKSGIKRPTCYIILDALVIKGIAGKTDDGRRTIYSVIDPKQLLQRTQSRQLRLERTLTQLEALGSKTPQKPQIRLLEGAEGVKQAYQLSLSGLKDSEILIYGTASIESLMPEFIADYIAERVKKGLKVRAILPDTPENRAVTARNSTELRETRFLPTTAFDPHLEINQFGSTITYIAHSEVVPFATVIDNKTLADVERQRFDLIWNIAVA